MSGYRVLIVGAGIAGPALARALGRHDISAEIVEQARRWVRSGTGIYLPGNGVRALRLLGVADELAPKGSHVHRQRFRSPDGVVLGEVDLDAQWADVAPCAGFHRADLHDALLRSGEPLSVRMGTTVQSIRVEDDGVAVELTDGTEDRFDVVVGADGIRSVVRDLVFGAVTASYAGETYWRTVVDEGGDVEGWTGYLGSDRLLGVVPIGHGRVYCFGVIFSDEPFEDPMAGRAERFRDLFGHLGAPTQLVNEVRVDDAVHFGPAEQLFVDPPVRGRVALLGDAAHANSPNMAQGACLAMEDAIVLADELAHCESPIDAIAKYAERRLPRTRQVRDATALRNQVVRLPADVRDPMLTNMADMTAMAFAPLLPPP